MRQYYTKNRQIVTNKEVNNQQKLISLYNQLNGTNYNLSSVGIELVTVAQPSNGMSGTPDKNFGFYSRTGQPYSKRFTEKELNKLQGRRG